MEIKAQDKPLETYRDVYERISERIVELYKEVEIFQNIIFVNRNHITAAKRRIRILERGVKLIEKGNTAKAIHLFDTENAKQSAKN